LIVESHGHEARQFDCLASTRRGPASKSPVRALFRQSANRQRCPSVGPQLLL